MSTADVIVLRAFLLDGARQEAGARLTLTPALAAELASAGKVALAGDVVSMPLAYWLAVTRYVIDVEAGIDEVEAARAVKE